VIEQMKVKSFNVYCRGAMYLPAREDMDMSQVHILRQQTRTDQTRSEYSEAASSRAPLSINLGGVGLARYGKPHDSPQRLPNLLYLMTFVAHSSLEVQQCR
jgi:hypothetical protein